MSKTAMDIEAIKRRARERAKKAQALQHAHSGGAGVSAIEEAVASLLAQSDRMTEIVVQALARDPEALVEAAGVESRLKLHEKAANEVAARHVYQMQRATEKLGRDLMEHLDTTLTEIKSQMLRKVEIVLPEMPAITFETAHKMLDRVVRKAAIRNHVVMVGPAGSGKGYAGRQTAEALGLPFFAKSCSIMDTKSDWVGFIDAGGTYHGTPFRWAFENGGVMFIDEMDAANPSVFVLINAALSDGVMGFPDGMVKAHPDFVVLAAANTWGRGADRQYRGRAVQDAASLNRFAKVAWDYDEDLERAIAPHADWCRYVQAVRAQMFAHRMQYVVSPRNTIMGGKELLAGAPLDEVAYDNLYADWDVDDVTKIDGLMRTGTAWMRDFHGEATVTWLS